MDIIEYSNIQRKVHKLHEHVDPRGCLEYKNGSWVERRDYSPRNLYC